MWNVREINVHECDIIREIRENFVSRTFHAYGTSAIEQYIRQVAHYEGNHIHLYSFPPNIYRMCLNFRKTKLSQFCGLEHHLRIVLAVNISSECCKIIKK